MSVVQAVWPWIALVLFAALLVDDPDSDRLFHLRNWVAVVVFTASIVGFAKMIF